MHLHCPACGHPVSHHCVGMFGLVACRSCPLSYYVCPVDPDRHTLLLARMFVQLSYDFHQEAGI